MLSVAVCLGNLPLQVKVAHIVQMPVHWGKQSIWEAAAPFCRHSVPTDTGTGMPMLQMGRVHVLAAGSGCLLAHAVDDVVLDRSKKILHVGRALLLCRVSSI